MSSFDPVEFDDDADNELKLDKLNIRNIYYISIENEEIIEPVKDFDLQTSVNLPSLDKNVFLSSYTYSKVYQKYAYDLLNDLDEDKKLTEKNLMHKYDSNYKTNYQSMYMSHLDHLDHMIKELDELANKKYI